MGELFFDMAGLPFPFQRERFSCSNYFVTRYYVAISLCLTYASKYTGVYTHFTPVLLLDGSIRVAGEECSLCGAREQDRPD